MNTMAQRKTTSKNASPDVDNKMREETEEDAMDRKKAISRLERN